MSGNKKENINVVFEIISKNVRISIINLSIEDITFKDKPLVHKFCFV